jgi:hypothetical protein
VTGPRRKKFLDASQITEAITEAAALASKQHIRVALAGGCAMQVYGSDRLTADVDLLASEYPEVTRKGILSFGGIKTTAKNGAPVDYIVRDDTEMDLYDAALDAARVVTGIPVPVVTVPYLGAIKLASGRGKDVQDLEFLLRAHPASLKAMRALVAKYIGDYAVGDLDSHQATAVLTAKKGPR